VPAWIISAIALIGGGFIGRQLLRAGSTAIRTIRGPVAAGATGLAVGAVGGDLLDPFFGGNGDGRGRRRRRRRALTQGDRDDIAFITALLGQPAGKMFATTLASRGR